MTNLDPFLSSWHCPSCNELMVDLSNEQDTMPVLLCVNSQCPNLELWTPVDGVLVRFCAVHGVPEVECHCPKEEVNP